MGWVLFYLSCQHIKNDIFPSGDGYNCDITLYTMLLVCKLSALSFCYKDGGQDPDKLTADQRERMVKEFPSIIEIISYAFFCQACALGIFFEFSDYKRFIESGSRCV